ncbi:MAG: hypothetical protein HY696_11285 [Deltaproteobacteria bacterium]|nr:hypothetical protein [Deltaproteobacteria bacterium]
MQRVQLRRRTTTAISHPTGEAIALAQRRTLGARVKEGLERATFGMAALPMGPLGVFSTKLGEGGNGEPTDVVATTATVGGITLAVLSLGASLGALKAVQLYRRLVWMPRETFAALPGWQQAIARRLSPGQYATAAEVPAVVAEHYRARHRGSAVNATLANAQRLADRLENAGLPLSDADTDAVRSAMWFVQDDKKSKGPAVIDVMELGARLAVLLEEPTSAVKFLGDAFVAATCYAHGAANEKRPQEIALHFFARGLQGLERLDQLGDAASTDPDVDVAILGRLREAYQIIAGKLRFLTPEAQRVLEADRESYLAAVQAALARVKALCNARLEHVIAHVKTSADAASCVRLNIDAPYLETPLPAWLRYAELGNADVTFYARGGASSGVYLLHLGEEQARDTAQLEILRAQRTLVLDRQAALAALNTMGETERAAFLRLVGLFVARDPDTLVLAVAEQRAAIEEEIAEIETRPDRLSAFFDAVVVPLLTAQRELAATQPTAFANAQQMLLGLSSIAVLRTPWHAEGRYRAALVALESENPTLVGAALRDYDSIAAAAAAAKAAAEAEAPTEPAPAQEPAA